jgi:hypothetical protein
MRNLALVESAPSCTTGRSPRCSDHCVVGKKDQAQRHHAQGQLHAGDDHNDPVADNVRGTLDAHIVLDRAIAGQGRYPAVNLLTSISRLAQSVWTAEQRTLVMRLCAPVARYEDTRDSA